MADHPPTYITLNQRRSYITLSHGPQLRALKDLHGPTGPTLSSDRQSLPPSSVGKDDPSFCWMKLEKGISVQDYVVFVAHP